MAEYEPKNKKLKVSIVSESITTEDFQSVFRSHWQTSTSLKTSTVELIHFPFRVCKISNFLENEKFLEELKSELSDVETIRAETDLYTFERTSDLAHIDTGNMGKLNDLFKNEMRRWMSTNTGIELNTTVSISAANYSDTDYLLCHDDNLSDRRIAFILYLSKEWTAEDGGSLDLFNTDACGLPGNIECSLIPEYNSLIFFEVAHNSYHQVAEITSLDKNRITINGWFHGPINSHIRPPRPGIELTFSPPSTTSAHLNSWIMDTYLLDDIKHGIQKEVEQNSYTYIAHFLQEEVYNEISTKIMSENIEWTRVGPANVRNYEVADEDTFSSTLKKFYDIFKSIDMFRLLKEYTELDLVPDGKDMKPMMTIELQRWSAGCYTLISDKHDEDGVSIHEDPQTEDNDHYGVEIHSETAVHNDGAAESAKQTSDATASVSKDRSSSSSYHHDIFEDNNTRIVPMKTNQPTDDGANCSKIVDSGKERAGITFCPDSDDDHTSDSESGNDLEGSDDESVTENGTLDVIMQFNTGCMSECQTIDYVNPKEQDGVLIQVPPEDNHFCLVYRTDGTCRVQKYVNHYCKGYFYNLICSYRE